jgi:hypothetical protein
MTFGTAGGEENENAAYPIWSYNAVKLAPRDVAESFVPPAAFDALVKSDNVVLTGPRGSGKTTLLKMLQSQALEFWSGDAAEWARTTVRSSGVFVGTDRLWHEQLRAGNFDTSETLGQAAFSLQVGQALTKAMNYRIRRGDNGRVAEHLRVDMSPSSERAVAEMMSEVFGLQRVSPTLSGTYGLFSAQLAVVGGLRRRLASVGALPSWTSIDPILAASAAAESFNMEAGEEDHKWCFLFDELELAPESVISELLRHLRGNEARFNYKLSMSPMTKQWGELHGAQKAVQGQDFEHVALTHARKAESVAFMGNLLTATLTRNGVKTKVRPQRLLGESLLDLRDNDAQEPDEPPTHLPRSARGSVTSTDGSEAISEPYKVGSFLWARMASLASKDASFASYLERHDLDLSQLEKLDPTERAAKVRKIRNIVIVRDMYRNAAGDLRSRKNYSAYHGASSILALPDGNPRLGIALIKELLPTIDARNTLRVPAATQNRAISRTMDRFLALIRAQEAVVHRGASLGLLELLDKIGIALADRLLRDDFSADPALGFSIDDSVPAAHLELLGQAANTGAIVHIPQLGEAPVSASMLGRSYRLSYLLAPRYGLPMSLGKVVELTPLLAGRRSGALALQLELDGLGE